MSTELWRLIGKLEAIDELIVWHIAQAKRLRKVNVIRAGWHLEAITQLESFWNVTNDDTKLLEEEKQHD